MKYPEPTQHLRDIIGMYFDYYRIQGDLRDRLRTACRDAALTDPTPEKTVAALNKSESDYTDAFLKNPDTRIGKVFAHPATLLSIGDILMGDADLENKKIKIIQYLKNAMPGDTIATAKETIIRKLKRAFQTVCNDYGVSTSSCWDINQMIDTLIDEKENVPINWGVSRGVHGVGISVPTASDAFVRPSPHTLAVSHTNITNPQRNMHTLQHPPRMPLPTQYLPPGQSVPRWSIAQGVVLPEGYRMALPIGHNPFAAIPANGGFIQHRAASYGLSVGYGIPYHVTPLYYLAPVPTVYHAPPPPPSLEHLSYTAGYAQDRRQPAVFTQRPYVPQPHAPSTPPLLQAQNAQHFVVPGHDMNAAGTSVWNAEPSTYRQLSRPNAGRPPSLQPIGTGRKIKAELLSLDTPSLVMSDVQMRPPPGREVGRFS